MACRIYVRRLASQLLNVDAACPHEHVKLCSPAMAFTTSAAKVQDDGGAVVVGRSSKDQEHAVTKQSRGASLRSFLPALFSPFHQPTSLMSMMDTMDRLFDIPVLSSVSGASSTVRNASSRLPWDVMEDDKCFKLRVDLPGFSKEELKVTVEDRDLVLSAEHDAEQKDDDWSSRSYGSYHVRIKLPENVDISGIKAEMKDGVLKVQAPKVEGPKEKHEVLIE